jgi:hypothetical protein
LAEAADPPYEIEFYVDDLGREPILELLARDAIK